MSDRAGAARAMWILGEPLHALTYFAPESQAAFEAAGLRGFWRGYFAGRAAPLGAGPAEVVTATFFGFHPDFVARAVPSIWTTVTPADAIAARLDGIDRALRRIFGTELPETDAAAAAFEIRRAVDATPAAGRALYGANRDLEWPEPPHLALWHAVTLLREHRGDGHVAVLTVAGVSPCDAHVLRIADDGLPLDSIQPCRGWTHADWSDAAARLQARGWLDASGGTTPSGRQHRAAIERDTDRLSAELVGRVEHPELVVRVLGAITERLTAVDAIPYPNPVGVPPPGGYAGV